MFPTQSIYKAVLLFKLTIPAVGWPACRLAPLRVYTLVPACDVYIYGWRVVVARAGT